ncbi:MAG: ATPase [Clostridiales bacterium]|nr:ATPase [Clostridiales bacterium]
MILYKNLSVRAGTKLYQLEFKNRITIVMGDSGNGKTYLYKFLEEYRGTEGYEDIVLFNYKSDDFHQRLQGMRHKFIVIDNADIMLDDTDKQFINFHKENQFLLFKRDFTNLFISPNSLVTLKQDGNIIRFKEVL